MSDTPRTDAALIQRGLDPSSKAPFVEFTRSLERELKAFKEHATDELMAKVDAAMQMAGYRKA